MSIQSPWHYYKVQKQLQLYMEELKLSCFTLTKFLPLHEKCELLDNLSKVFFAFLYETRTRSGCSPSFDMKLVYEANMRLR